MLDSNTFLPAVDQFYNHYNLFNIFPDTALILGNIISWSILFVLNKLSYMNLALLLSFNFLSVCNLVSVVF